MPNCIDPRLAPAKRHLENHIPDAGVGGRPGGNPDGGANEAVRDECIRDVVHLNLLTEEILVTEVRQRFMV